jgi:ankyrin repeat protein
VLIQAGADLNIKNQLGLSALDFAVRGNRQNAKELIETGLHRLAARTAISPASNAAVKDVTVTGSEKSPAPAPAPMSSNPSVSPSITAPQPASKPFKTGW